MTATLEEIYRDPGILTRAIEQRERLEILREGKIAAEVVPCGEEVVLSSSGDSLPIHRGGSGLHPGVNLENREQMWDLAGGV